MTSQLNNPNENNDQVLQETESLRPLFFENTSKRSPAPSSEPQQLSRLDAAVDTQHLTAEQTRPTDDTQNILTSLTPSETTLMDIDPTQISHTHLILQRHHHLLSQPSLGLQAGAVVQLVMQTAEDVASSSHFSKETPKPRKNSLPRVKKAVRLPLALPSASASSATKTPKLYRRFRLRSLPIINYTLRSQIAQPTAFARLGVSGQHATHQTPANTSSKGGNHSSGSSGHSRSSKTASSGHHHSLYRHIPSFGVAPLLPPINLQSLKEIDLQEILKNPQLRHDILFDPQLQFRPNLDGERGRRKKTVIERYWVEIEHECKQFFDAAAAQTNGNVTPPKATRLRALFTTLREILLSLLPLKDRQPVNEIMDIDLIVQQLNYGLFDFVAMAKWLGDVFKSHCAPMRDSWVLDMIQKFQQAYDEGSVSKLVEGLRLIFLILEAMKLDVANHQIRILRPVLIETATDFEKDYFHQLITHCKRDISDSLKWFHRAYTKRLEARNGTGLRSTATIGGVSGAEALAIADIRPTLTTAVIELLSCRNMATEFPSTLAFDHTRLVLLRADVRQLVCVQLCIVLFKQVCSNYAASHQIKNVSLKPEAITAMQEQILAIVTDDNGNVKWTRNVQAIALQLVKNAVSLCNNSAAGSADIISLAALPQPLVDFCYNWLLKQIQPNTDVYGLMEEKIFKELAQQIERLVGTESATTGANNNHNNVNNGKHNGNGDHGSGVKNADGTTGSQPALPEGKPANTGMNILKQRKADSEMAGISFRISTLVKFHWSVFGDYYTEYVRQNDSLNDNP